MKKVLFLAAMLLLLPSSVIAQNKTTCFLGIPVDGFKKDVVKEVKEKGFKHHVTGNYFTGYHYGYPVYLFIESHQRIVNRVTVYDIPQQDEEGIRKRFNELCDVFEKSGQYVSINEKNPRISKKEDLSTEMRLHGKMYKAIYRQVNADKKSLAWSPELAMPAKVDSIETVYDIESLRERRRRVHVKALKFVSNIYTGPYKNVVWFSVSEKFNRYAIVLVYENYNNGD